MMVKSMCIPIIYTNTLPNYDEKVPEVDESGNAYICDNCGELMNYDWDMDYWWCSCGNTFTE